MILDANGQPVSSESIAAAEALEGEPAVFELPKFCPRCGEGSAKRKTHRMYGAHWKVVCFCGLQLAKGRGLPPLDGEGEEFDE